MRAEAVVVSSAGLLVLWVACAGVDSRIASRRELFDSYPPEVQANLRHGVIEPGYTPEMVEIALGSPDEKRELTTEQATGEIWTYRRSVPGFSFGLGSGTSVGNHVGLGTGVQVGEPARREDQALVEFREGRVVRFESLAPRAGD